MLSKVSAATSSEKADTAAPALDATAEAVADGQAAIKLVRQRAKEWHVDPARVGMLGFSAGAITTLSVGFSDKKSVRPDFIAPRYPASSERGQSSAIGYAENPCSRGGYCAQSRPIE